MNIEDELHEALANGEVDTELIRLYIGGGYIPTAGLVLQLCGEIDALRAFADIEAPATGDCAVCGVSITQKSRGRHRKYCGGCAERLRHRTPATQARKYGAEKATAGL